MATSRKQTVLDLKNTKLDKAVLVQGTDYDRKRKVTHSMAVRMKSMLDHGKSVSYVANHFGVSNCAVRYNTDEDYRQYMLESCSGVHTGVDTCTPKDRAAYKRSLVANNKKVIYNID